MSESPSDEPIEPTRPDYLELKVAAAALAAAASAPLGIAVAGGAALSSRNVSDMLRRGTVKAVAGALEASDQITAAVARRTTPDESPAPAEPTVDA
jgi:hypothetical protein